MKKKLKNKQKKLSQPETKAVKQEKQPEREQEEVKETAQQDQEQKISSKSILGKRKATLPPIKEIKEHPNKDKKEKPQRESSKEPAQKETEKPVKSQAEKKESKQTKEVVNIPESNSYKQQQEEHLKTIERERKYQQNKRMREQREKEEQEADEELQFWQGPSKRTKKSGKGGKGDDDEVEQGGDSDREKDSNAIDMRREDAELEKILRDYNNEARQSKKKRDDLIEKPLDLPYYKGIQLPEHLKWVTIHSKANESVLMQEVYALDLEIKRLKELKALHKEFRRYVEMPIGVMSRPCQCCRGWSKKKHYCSHEFCEKPCKKQEEQLGQPKPAKESVIQQQIRNVYLQTMQKMQQMNPLGLVDGTALKDQNQPPQPYYQYMGGDPNMNFANNFIFPMVDERNKRGRPPKKPKNPEQEQKEKQELQQKIIRQLQQQSQQLGGGSDQLGGDQFRKQEEAEEQQAKQDHQGETIQQ